jgi:hypothetical protein
LVTVRPSPPSHHALLISKSEDKTNLQRHARRNAEEAVALARQRALDFDAKSRLERKTMEAVALAKAQGHDMSTDLPTTGLTDC